MLLLKASRDFRIWSRKLNWRLSRRGCEKRQKFFLSGTWKLKWKICLGRICKIREKHFATIPYQFWINKLIFLIIILSLRAKVFALLRWKSRAVHNATEKLTSTKADHVLFAVVRRFCSHNLYSRAMKY